MGAWCGKSALYLGAAAEETDCVLYSLDHHHGSDDPRNARVVIDACTPFRRRDTFPIVVRASKEVEDHVRGKFSDVLPRG